MLQLEKELAELRAKSEEEGIEEDEEGEPDLRLVSQKCTVCYALSRLVYLLPWNIDS